MAQRSDLADQEKVVDGIIVILLGRWGKCKQLDSDPIIRIWSKLSKTS